MVVFPGGTYRNLKDNHTNHSHGAAHHLPLIPDRRTLPTPEQEAQAAAEKQELMEGLAVGEDTERQKDRPGRSSARLEC